jgi:hypothetical protein
MRTRYKMHNTNLRSKESQTLMSQNVTKRYKDNIFTSMYVWHRVEVLIYAVIIIFFNILLLVTKEYRCITVIDKVLHRKEVRQKGTD